MPADWGGQSAQCWTIYIIKFNHLHLPVYSPPSKLQPAALLATTSNLTLDGAISDMTYLLPVGKPVVEAGCTAITAQPAFCGRVSAKLHCAN